MKKRSLQSQFKSVLYSKTRFGESKRDAKQVEGKNLYGIYSHSTLDNYIKVTQEFCNYLKKHNITCNNMAEAKIYIEPYLQERIDRGLSSWTISRDKSAFMKIYSDLTLNLKGDIVRQCQNIKRSRNIDGVKFNTNLLHNKDLQTFCETTGLRRTELNNFKNLKLENVRFTNGQFILFEVKGKGGKVRNVPVLKSGNAVLMKFVDVAKSNGWGRLFGEYKVNSKAPIHHYRANYAKSLYNELAINPIQENLKYYYNFKYDKGYLADYTKNNGQYKSAVFKQTYDRLAVCIVSQALGHNRDNVAVTNYIGNK